MTKNPQLLSKINFKLQNPLESNPQLFREIKGKISGKNIFIASLISLFMQLFVVAIYFGKLPDIAETKKQYSRYCTGVLRNKYSPKYLCMENIKGWTINWELFWHDIFIVLTVASILILLIVGTFMIIADLVKEEKTGTLNFIRLSPQSASNIFLGKILGVPVLVYFFIATILPLHSFSGLNANIPWYSILFFDLIVIASCGFFYSLSVLFSLSKIGKAELKPWILAFVVTFFIGITTIMFFSHLDIYNSLAEYLLFLNPIFALTYLLDPLFVNHRLVSYMELESLSLMLFYGQPLWAKATIGMSFILFNYCLWAYWFWQGATRLFHNPTSTIFSKKQSYWLTGWFVLIALGFTLQSSEYHSIADNFIMLQCLLLVMFLGLIAALSPHRQTLYDWARYRHQLSKDGNLLWKELVFAEKSPSTIAIAINASIAIIIITIGSLFFSFPGLTNKGMAWILILTMGMVLLYSVIAQLMLLMKNNKRVIWTSITISALIICPPILFAIAEATPQQAPLVWLFSFVPFVGIEHASMNTLILGVLGQWLAITCTSFLMVRKLRQAGRSETKKLLGS